MKTFFKRPFFLFKLVIVTLALGNLVFLFAFNYELPGFLSNSSSKEDSLEADNSNKDDTENDANDKDSTENDTNGNDSDNSSTDSDSTLQIVVPDEPFVYDGSDTLNLNNQVAVLKGSKTPITDVPVFTTIIAGESTTKKVIEYSIQDDEGNRITARRDLILNNYTGPSITLLDEIPELKPEDIPHLLSILQNENLISAEDGYGNDITASITSKTTSEDMISGIYVVTMNIVNLFNDTFSTEVTVHAPLTKPVLKLNTNEITLKVGEPFLFYRYIEYAKDIDGTNLNDRISMRGSVNTSKAGTYTLQFYCSDVKGNTSSMQTLTVHVVQ